MRVAIFTDNDFDKVNGVTTTLRAVLRHAPEGLQPRIYTASDLAVETPQYFSPASFGIGLPWYREMRIYWPRLRKLARALRQDHVGVVHVTTPGPVGLAGRFLAQRLGLPLIGSYHTNLGEYVEKFSGLARFGRGLDRYMRWLYGPCNPVLVPSEATRQRLIEGGYDASRLQIWARGVDTLAFSPGRRSAVLRDRWHVDARRPAVLYAGRISREKGLDLIAPIQRALDRRGLPHRFVFAGDGPMRKALETECADGLFLGTLPHDGVGAVMASSDIFLFPSATDTLGNVVLEAQAAGLPVLVSDAGGPREQIVDGVTGFVCKAGDPDAFARRLEMLLGDSAQRSAMGHAAHEHVVSRGWSIAMAPLHQAWQNAARRAAPASDPVTIAGKRQSKVGV